MTKAMLRALLQSSIVPCALLLAAPAFAASVYQPSWTSVDQHNPTPEWFKDAKFGIYFHWGVYSVPAFENEWYPRNMYNTGDAAYSHHLATYGDPFSSWPYHGFINGANDNAGHFTQFAPRLASAGGAFDPAAWAQLFADAGARFAGPVAEHHDGFSDWNSTANEWNAVNKGPHLDLAAQLGSAIRAQGLKFLMAMHHAYHFTGYYQYVPQQSDSSLKKLYGQLGTTAENQLWYDKLKEIIDGYQPDIIWQDFNLSAVQESQRLNFLAYYYNKAIDWNKEVVATYKDGFDQKGEVLDYERGGPGDLTSYYWLTDDAISPTSWCYTSGIQYYASTALLHALIDRVSKNGNMLLNISPMADGSIPQAQQTVLRAMGGWLKQYGEAIYATRAWTTYGEGPTKMGGGSFTGPTAGTPQDIRYTRSKDNTVLYAVVLGWPGNGATVKLASLSSGAINLSTLTGVQLITGPGTYAGLSYRQDSTALNVTLPGTQPFSAPAYALRLTFSGQIPAATAPATQTLVVRHSGKLADVNGGSLADGATVIQWTANGGANQRWTFQDAGSGYSRVVNKNSGKCLDVNGASTADGAAVIQWACGTQANQQWQLKDLGNGWLQLVARHSGKCLDVSGASTADGTPLIQWTCGNGANQMWQRQ